MKRTTTIISAALVITSLITNELLSQNNSVNDCNDIIEILRSKQFKRFSDTFQLEKFLRDSLNGLNYKECPNVVRGEVLLARSRARRSFKSSANRFVDSALAITKEIDTIFTLRTWNEKVAVAERGSEAREKLLEEYVNQSKKYGVVKYMYMSHFNLGQLKRGRNQYNHAIKYLMIADSAIKTTIKLENTPDPLIRVAIISELAAVYNEIRDNERSIELYRKAMALCGDCKFASIIRNNIGNAFVNQPNPDSAIHYFNQAIPLTKSKKTKIYSHQGLASAYALAKEYQKSTAEAQYVLDRINPNGSRREGSIALNMIAAKIIAKSNLGDPDSANILFQKYKYLAQNVGYTPSVQSFYRQGFRSYLSNSKRSEILTPIFDSLVTTMDSVYSKDIVEEVQKVRESYEARERESEIKAITLESNLSKAKSQKRLILFSGSSLASICLVVFSVFMFRKRKEIQISKSKIEDLNHNLSKQNSSIQALNRELNHRTANQISLAYELILDQRRQIGDEHAKASLERSESQLMALREVNRALAHRSDDLVRADEVLTKVAEGLQAASPYPFTLDLQLKAITVHGNAASRSALILSELLSNSIKYAFPNTNAPQATIRISQNEQGTEISYLDNGPGSDGTVQGTGVGSGLIEAMLEDLDAEFEEIKDEDGTGYGMRWWWG